MATLIGPVPPGLTFPALVGGTMPDTPPHHSAPARRPNGEQQKWTQSDEC